MATQGNWWDSYEVVDGPSAAPPVPSYPGVIQGRTPQPTAIEQGRYDMDRAGFDISQIRAELEVDKLNRDRLKENLDAEKLAQAQVNGISDSISQLRRTIQAAKEAKGLSNGWFATGMGAETARSIGGTTAADVQALLNTIGSNTAFDRLQKMRDESPTGGALGAVSEVELRLLRDSISSLEQGQSDTQFQASMDRIIDAYGTVLGRLEQQQNPNQRDNPAGLANLPANSSPPGPQGSVPPDGGARAPTQQDVYSGGVTFGMDQWGQSNPFDRDEYLARQYGLQGDQEAQTIAFWNKNRGNGSLTVDNARQWYAENGIRPPTDPDLQAAVEQAQRGESFAGISTTDAENRYTRQLDQVLEQQGTNPEDLSNTIGLNAAQGVSFGFGDEIAGLGGAAEAIYRGRDPVSGYQVGRDLVRRQQERSREARPVTSLASELGGGLVTGRAGFTGVNSVGSAARAGAQMGALAGFGYGEGLAGSVGGALVGAGAGAGISAGMQAAAPIVSQYGSRAVSALGNRFSRRPTATSEQLDLIAAANRQGVDLRAPDVREDLRQTRATLLSEGGEAGTMIRNAADDDLIAMQNARANISPGNAAVDNYAAGERVSTAANRYIDNTRSAAGRQYDRVEQLTSGQTFTPAQAVQVATDEIERLRGNGANQSLINFMEEVQRKLARPEGWTPTQLHAFRSGLRSDISAAGLSGEGATAAELPAIRAISAASDDLVQALSGNPAALRAARRADNLWREQAQYKKEISSRLLGRSGNNSPDEIARALESMVKGDTQRLRGFWNNLDPEEQSDLASTFAERLGNDAQGNFSLARFLSQTQGKQALANRRNMRLMFGDRGMQAVDDLRAIARAKVDAADRTNWSGTAGATRPAVRGLRMLLMTSLGNTMGGVGGAVAAPAADAFISRVGANRMARLLTNPDFTRWIRRAPTTTNPATIDRYFRRLDSIAARTPGMRADVEAWRNSLVSAVNDNGSRLAAEPNDAGEQR